MKKFDYMKSFRYFVVVALTLVVIGMVMLGVLGFNSSSDYVPAYEVTCTADESFGNNNSLMKSTASKVFKDNKVNYVSVSDKDDGCIVIYEFKKAVPEKVITDLQSAMDEAFASSTVDVEVLGRDTVGHKSSAEVWWAVLAVGVLLVLAFFYLVLRYRWAAAFAMLVAVVAEVLVSVALTAITRVPVTTAYLAMAVLGAVMTIMLSVYFFSVIKEDMRVSGKGTASEFVNRAFAGTFMKNMITLGAAVLAVIALLAIGGTAVKFAALQLLVVAISAVFVALGLTGGIYALFKQMGKKKN